MSQWQFAPFEAEGTKLEQRAMGKGEGQRAREVIAVPALFNVPESSLRVFLLGCTPKVIEKSFVA